MFPSPTIALISTSILLAVYLLYRATLPKLIPGIPYVKASANKPFGDLRDGLAYIAKTKDFSSFMGQKCVELKSPVVQVSFLPFGRPWVVLTDGQE